jgi:hypothetical protein
MKTREARIGSLDFKFYFFCKIKLPQKVIARFVSKAQNTIEMPCRQAEVVGNFSEALVP